MEYLLNSKRKIFCHDSLNKIIYLWEVFDFSMEYLVVNWIVNFTLVQQTTNPWNQWNQGTEKQLFTRQQIPEITLLHTYFLWMFFVFLLGVWSAKMTQILIKLKFIVFGSCSKCLLYTFLSYILRIFLCFLEYWKWFVKCLWTICDFYLEQKQ